ncbi:MAG: phospholipase D-like domain-containing protein [Methylococcaceae bacterium]|jgi:cardiolipin synthase
MQNVFSNHSVTWPIFIGILHLVFSIPTAIHVLLRKDDERAAIGWIGLVFLSPFLGSGLYWLFGINRVKARAKLNQAKRKKRRRLQALKVDPVVGFDAKWQTLMRAGSAIHDSPYLPHNQVKPLINGDMAYPRMLEAIYNAKRDIVLSSYIFDYDTIGQKFVDALSHAQKRNVAVYVLIDGDFLNFRGTTTERELGKKGIMTARFLPFNPRFINLRNHRKILCVDGQVAFIGGLNIRQANLLGEHPRYPVQDIHFEIKGPVINQISKTFSDDWEFATGKSLKLTQCSASGDGQVTCRALPDGPDGNFQKLVWLLIAAINAATHNIRIMTPYFIPGHTLISALKAASLRGVAVELIVPKKNNIPFFNWAMQANFNDLLKFGLKIYLSAPPFEHSKIFLVDDGWSFIGSSNWDTRSLALNFEVNVECFDNGLNTELVNVFNEKKAKSLAVTKATPSRYTLFIHARNNFFRLLSPYL